MRTFGGIQISSNVLKASRPNGRVEKQQSTGSRIVGEEKDVAFDEDLEILKFIKLKDPKLKRIKS